MTTSNATAIGTGDAEARLEAALRGLGEGIHRHGGGLEALILAGSLSRGEGSWIQSAPGQTLLGDADVLLVAPAARRLPDRRQSRAWETAVERELERAAVQAHVTVRTVRRSYLTALPPHIFGYELKYTGRVLWGDANVLDLIPGTLPGELPREDAWRLLANRVVELAADACGLRGRACRTAAEAYPWVKLYLDLATSYLAFTGHYAPSYRQRLQQLQTQAANRSQAGEEHLALPPAVMGRVAACTAWKLAPRGTPPVLARPGATAQAARDAETLWCWELRQMTGAPAEMGREALWQRWLRQQGYRNRLRGWASAARHLGVDGCRQWPRWARLGPAVTPRHLVYQSAAALFFSHGHPSAVPQVRLPLSPAPAGATPRSLAQAARHDFQLLVQNTRA